MTDALTQPSVNLRAEHSSRRYLVLAMVIALGFFCYLSADARRMDFSRPSENLAVQAAMEIKRGGPWWIPNMNGVPRVTKPPLPTWITAAAISDQTIKAMNSADPAVREQAYRDLAWEVRWPASASAALMLLGVYVMGSMLLSPVVGIMSMLIAGTALLTFRYGRMASTDIQIALWVTWASACLAAGLVRQKRWCLAAGGALLGLGIMSKGPVSLVQSALPAIVFAVAIRPRTTLKPLLMPALAGLALMLAISLPWPLSIYLGMHDVVGHWVKEITRVGATDLTPDPWYGYWNLVPNMMPWVPLFIGGLCVPFIARLRERGAVFAWLLFVVPVLVMSFAHDKPERYGLPLVGPAAILCAHVAAVLARTRGQWRPTDKLLVICQWAILLIAPIAFVVAGLQFGPKYGVSASVVLCAGLFSIVVAIVALIARRRPWSLVIGVCLATLPVYAVAEPIYAASPNGRSEGKVIAQRVLDRYGDFRAFHYEPRAVPRNLHTDLGIYLNRAIVRVRSVSEIPPSSQTTLVFMLQRKNEPMPVCPGGELQLSNEIDKQWCHVFLLTETAR